MADKNLAEAVVRSDGSGKPVLGVTSSRPALVIGSREGKGKKGVAVALSGRVPVQIASSSREIKTGDFITASPEPGRAMKAYRPGQVIGIALEDWSSGSKKDRISVFIEQQYYDPQSALASTDNFQITNNKIQTNSNNQTGQFDVLDASGQMVDRVGAYSELAVADLSAGAISASNITLSGVDIASALGTANDEIDTLSTSVYSQSQDISKLEDLVLGFKDSVIMTSDLTGLREELKDLTAQNSEFALTSGEVLDGTVTSTAFDLSQMYSTKDTNLEAGDLVVLENGSEDDEKYFVRKSSAEYKDDVLGVVSEKPGFQLGGNSFISDQSAYQVPVALSGRVPVKIDKSAGTIKSGDMLAVSENEQGKAVKATKMGWVVGRALNDAKPDDNTVMMFVSLMWYNGTENQLADLQNLLDGIEDIDALKTNLASALEISENEGIMQSTFTSDLTVIGDATVNSLTSLGEIKARLFKNHHEKKTQLFLVVFTAFPCSFSETASMSPDFMVPADLSIFTGTRPLRATGT